MDDARVVCDAIRSSISHDHANAHQISLSGQGRDAEDRAIRETHTFGDSFHMAVSTVGTLLKAYVYYCF